MNTPKQAGMTPALYTQEAGVQQYYAWRAGTYDRTTGYEAAHHRAALALAAVRPGEQVLEVACGTGRATVDLAQAVGATGHLEALDLSAAMLRQAQAKIARRGLQDRVAFRLGQAQHLPFAAATFDVLYNAYMFDLLPTAAFPAVLAEFGRVLKPGGRLIVLNMSKPGPRRTVFERLYKRGWVGACRPVLLRDFVRQAGFVAVQRRYRPNHFSPLLFPLLWGAEIVSGRRPG